MAHEIKNKTASRLRVQMPKLPARGRLQEAVEAHPEPMAALTKAAECLKVLGHPARLRMVQLLLRDEYTVGALADMCDIPQHVASEHLRLMQHCGFFSQRKEGRKVFYQVAEPHLANIMNCIEARFFMSDA